LHAYSLKKSKQRIKRRGMRFQPVSGPPDKAERMQSHHGMSDITKLASS